MTEIAQALHDFFASFGIPAYEENSVSDKAVLPYITYELADPGWRDVAVISASVWYEGYSLKNLLATVDKIKAKIGEGLSIPVENGSIWLYKETPFAQIIGSEDDKIRACYLLIGMHALCV